MPGKKHSRESIIQTLQCLAQNLGKKALTTVDVRKHMPLSSLDYHFGSLRKALEAAGLEMRHAW